IRRIEAICGQKVYEYITNLKHTLHSVATLLGTNDIAEIKNKIEKLIQQNKKLQQELENVRLNLTTKNVEEFNKEKNLSRYFI
ncbi:MAG: hypothetical protein N2505_07125, partial [Endomicrobia bacterium]|nr:hypothetical protein [Endomicrobiia bacterium]